MLCAIYFSYCLMCVLFECQFVMDVQQTQNNFYSSCIYLKDRIYLYLGRRSNNVLTQLWPFLLLFHAAVFLGTHIVQGMCCTWWYSISRVMHTQNHTNQRKNFPTCKHCCGLSWEILRIQCDILCSNCTKAKTPQ